MSTLERPNPPAPGKVTHFSIELFWKVPKLQDPKVSVVLQQSEGKEAEYSNVYTGFGKKSVVKDLGSDCKYKFRLKYMQGDVHSDWSAITEVKTNSKPLNGDDLHKAVLQRSITTIKKLLEQEDINIDAPDKFGSSALMSSCIKGFNDIAELLLSFGANVEYANSAGKTSLMMSCYHGNLGCIEVLLGYKANWDAKDKSGATAFHWAIDGGHIHVVEKILEYRTDIDEPDHRSGWSPLMRLVAVNGNSTIAKLLIDCGADVNYKDNSGKTVLMAACVVGNKALTELLINSGANIWEKNGFGNTAYDMAKSLERRGVMKYLEEIEEFYPRPDSAKVSQDSIHQAEH